MNNTCSGPWQKFKSFCLLFSKLQSDLLNTAEQREKANMRSLSKGGDLLFIYYSVFGTKRMALLDKELLVFWRCLYAKFYPVYPLLNHLFSFLTVKLNQMLSYKGKVKGKENIEHNACLGRDRFLWSDPYWFKRLGTVMNDQACLPWVKNMMWLFTSLCTRFSIHPQCNWLFRSGGRGEIKVYSSVTLCLTLQEINWISNL